MSEYKVRFTKPYLRKEARFLKKHPVIIRKYEKTIALMEANPHHPSLRLHKLKGSLQEYYSVSINM